MFLDKEPGLEAESIKRELNNRQCKYNKNIQYLGFNNIRISYVELLDSKKSLPIQYADILAHSTFKIFEEPEKVKPFAEIINLYINGLYVTFQGFDCNEKLSKIICNCDIIKK
ncbi:MAG: hypothetical protein ACRCUM_00860 [Mycoplasmoidaceae bacterium]